MIDFRRLSQRFSASAQIDAADVAEAARLGFCGIINNRPDGEDPDQPQSADIAAAALHAGIDFNVIPITHAGFSAPQISEMRRILDDAEGPVLAYCRSGTRSTLLWALAQAEAGEHPETLAQAAAVVGYDVSPIRALMDALAADKNK